MHIYIIRYIASFVNVLLLYYTRRSLYILYIMYTLYIHVNVPKPTTERPKEGVRETVSCGR